ncbi:hypothetical protein BDV23DRAFT_186538 [Aspergillus alliaceus]|uniref:Uncharacterized protein n=1 Tax=Petromyces alliaceus TaxID=209559 RepID=A0A5N7BZL6_PETAA|nr:hypothetical protein BDV23DRAFT_186538 [Aspergillus alliaceus]
MNWTGGRLPRHSASSGPQPKYKRQGIGKSRLDASQGPRQVTLFDKVSQSKKLDSDGNTLNRHQQPPIPPPLSSNQATARVEHIKRHLLDAVSAARPLKISFPSPEELAQFGKRRKRTEGG